jgi:signal peptidase II
MVRRAAPWVALGVLCAGLDAATKALSFARVGLGGEVPVLPGFYSVACALNPGTLWSFGRGASLLWLVLSILAVPTLIGMLAAWKKPGWIPRTALAFVLGGALGNMVDRVREGAVRDFIKFYVVRADGSPAVWPIFNLADSFIFVGAFLLTVEAMFAPEETRPTA